MSSRNLLPLLPLALASVLPRPVANYNGHKVLRVSTAGNATAVMESLSALNYNQWSDRVGGHLDISLSAEDFEKFQALSLTLSIMHEDLGASSPLRARRRQIGALPSEAWFKSYHDYEHHVQYWDDLHAAFPDNSERFVVGHSYEGREIFGLKLFGTNDTGVPKKAVIWHGTVHARKWISTMSVEYLTYSIINGHKNNIATYRDLLDKFDFYILPVVNPDGFVYSQTHDRLWRKNRVPHRLADGKTCYGTDPNRNWPYQWNITIGNQRKAGSSDPCAESYKGQAPGDTPETQALVSHMQNVSQTQNLSLYIDFHAYGNQYLIPYGYTYEKAGKVWTVNDMTGFWVGPVISNYPVTGGSQDYAYDAAGAQYAYVMEISDDLGESEFEWPEFAILSTSQEVLAGVLVLLQGV
ncbi:hypothetical protein DOTSEDRAFT_90517 [Dothistroma septosporum NZE10]|uniref:Peptidase M14 domain-containing protein n=1 Tax=Dothistroma septosporum (strain NZE10 / CBS 128990) TaxID=675120 RepID=N1PGM3_DOTSN|nr:hypothetical protein DOTSEDRAFT_90517 [Dothistroma septosporum NZE10]